MVYLALKYGKRSYIRDMLPDFHINVDMRLRHGEEVHILNEPIYNTEVGLRAFEKCAPRLYSKLPVSVKSATTLEIFKKKL